MNIICEHTFYLRTGNQTLRLGMIRGLFIYKADELLEKFVEREQLNLREIKRAILQEGGMLLSKTGREQVVLASFNPRTRGKVTGQKKTLKLLGLAQKLITFSWLLLWPSL